VKTAAGALQVRPRTDRPSAAPRDQNESAFASILAALVARVPGAQAAALVDQEGETVDYAGRADPFSVRVAAAHLHIVLDDARAQSTLGQTSQILIRAARAGFVVRALPEGYALVLCLARGAGFRGCTRALPYFARLLAEEAGWPRERLEWYAVDVVVDARGLPHAVRRSTGSVVGLELLGRFCAALPQRERAWRARLETGVEVTLLRESGARWYADERV
jgi:hypothetical protein